MSFCLYPAIDLLDGQSVRLQKGQRNSAHQVHADPLEQLNSYSGCQWAHIVNLNAAFGDATDDTGSVSTSTVLKNLLKSTHLQIQLGGGLRSQKSAETALQQGIHRIVIGTWAVKDTMAVCKLAQRYPGQIVVGLDTLNNEIQVHGWTGNSGLNVHEFGKMLKEHGIQTVLHTQIERDGMLTGVDANAQEVLHVKTGLEVLCSGGVKNLEDIKSLSSKLGVTGVIIGKALAAGTLNLEEALAFQRIPLR